MYWLGVNLPSGQVSINLPIKLTNTNYIGVGVYSDGYWNTNSFTLADKNLTTCKFTCSNHFTCNSDWILTGNL